MKKISKKILFLLPVLALTSCGLGVKDLVLGTQDNSPNWKDNYYYNFDESFKSATLRSNRELNSSDKVFTQYDSLEFKTLEPDFADPKYYTSETSEGYGPNRKLSNYMSDVKDGYMSKLFDGILFCKGRYEKARVQIKESGISKRFNYRNVEAKYFAVQFKSALDFKTYKDIYPHYADIKMNVSFYFNDEKHVVKDTYSYVINNMVTNGYESVSIYDLFGFSLENINMKDCIGFSLDYELLFDEYLNEKKSDIDHALLLYEILMPSSSWVRL